MVKKLEMKQFIDWIDFMPEFLEEFQVMVHAKENSKEFDYSARSLDLVEEWILNRYLGTEDMLHQSESQNVNLLSCYIGETMLRRRGGNWDIQLDPDFAFHGVPIITLPDGDIECPLTLATASADRRTGDFIRSVVCNE